MAHADSRIARTKKQIDPVGSAQPRQMRPTGQLREQLRQLEKDVQVSPPASYAGERFHSDPADAAAALGLNPKQTQLAAKMIREVADDIRDMYKIGVEATNAGIPDPAIRAIFRRGLQMRHRSAISKAEDDNERDGAAPPKKGPPKKGPPQKEEGPPKKKGSAPPFGKKGGDDKDAKEEDDGDIPGPADEERGDPRGPVSKRFEQIKKKGKAHGVRISGKVSDHHTHDHLDALESKLDDHIVTKITEKKAKQAAAQQPAPGAMPGQPGQPGQGAPGQPPGKPGEGPMPHDAQALKGQIHAVLDSLTHIEPRLESEHQHGMFEQLMEEGKRVLTAPNPKAIEWLKKRIDSFVHLVTGEGGEDDQPPGPPSGVGPPTGAPMGGPPMGKSDAIYLDLRTGSFLIKGGDGSPAAGAGRPPGGGWQAVGNKGGFKKRAAAGKWQYWYPDDDPKTAPGGKQHVEELADYKLEIVGSNVERAKHVAQKMKEGIDKAADICKLNPPVCQGNLGIGRDNMPQIMETSIKQMLQGSDEDKMKAQAAIDLGADPNTDKTIKDQLLEALQKEGVKVEKTKVAAGELKATQREIKAGKSYGMADAHLKGKFNPAEEDIIISSDNHILDGHHRWAALLIADPGRPMNVTRVDMPMKDFLARSFKQPGVFRADLQGNIIDPKTPIDLSGDKPKSAEETAKSLSKAGGGGWQPIPHSRVGGERRPKAGGGFEYRYPNAGPNRSGLRASDVRAQRSQEQPEVPQGAQHASAHHATPEIIGHDGEHGKSGADHGHGDHAPVKITSVREALKHLGHELTPKALAHRVVHAVQHTAQEFVTAGKAIGKLLDGEAIDRHDVYAMFSAGTVIASVALAAHSYGASYAAEKLGKKIVGHIAAAAVHNYMAAAYTGYAAAEVGHKTLYLAGLIESAAKLHKAEGKCEACAGGHGGAGMKDEPEKKGDDEPAQGPHVQAAIKKFQMGVAENIGKLLNRDWSDHEIKALMADDGSGIGDDAGGGDVSKAERPPGGGWETAPRGKKGGFRRRKGSGWEYWYPGQNPRGPGKPKAQGGETRMSKKELTQLLTNGHYSIISAGRNPAHPDEAAKDPHDPMFAARHEQLKRDLTAAGFKYTEAIGHYGGEEPSLVVFHQDAKGGPKKQQKSVIVHHTHDSEHETIRKLGTKYNQDSVIHSKGGRHAMVFTTGEHKGSAHSGRGFDFMPHAEDFYTKYNTTDQGATKFSLNFDFDQRAPLDPMFKSTAPPMPPLSGLVIVPEGAHVREPAVQVVSEIRAIMKSQGVMVRQAGDRVQLTGELSKAGVPDYLLEHVRSGYADLDLPAAVALRDHLKRRR
jgi:hypothetical protein